MQIHGHGTGKCAGVTALELLVTVAIGGVLLTTAVPAWEQFTQRQRMKAAVGSLHNDLLAGRIDAVYRSSSVLACPGHPELGCSGANDWSDGWIVFRDPNRDGLRQPEEALLRHGQAVEQIYIFSAKSRSEIRFFPDGSAPGSNGSISLCGLGGPQKAKKVVISNVGRIRRDEYPGIDPAFCPAGGL
jgi:type IV fimbrial biogenesis protein FimT